MLRNYRVELAQELLDEQGQVIDWLIGFAFDHFGTHVLNLRVVPSQEIRPATRDQLLAGTSA